MMRSPYPSSTSRAVEAREGIGYRFLIRIHHPVVLSLAHSTRPRTLLVFLVLRRRSLHYVSAGRESEQGLFLEQFCISQV